MYVIQLTISRKTVLWYRKIKMSATRIPERNVLKERFLDCLHGLKDFSVQREYIREKKNVGNWSTKKKY